MGVGAEIPSMVAPAKRRKNNITRSIHAQIIGHVRSGGGSSMKQILGVGTVKAPPRIAKSSGAGLACSTAGFAVKKKEKKAVVLSLEYIFTLKGADSINFQSVVLPYCKTRLLSNSGVLLPRFLKKKK